MLNHVSVLTLELTAAVNYPAVFDSQRNIIYAAYGVLLLKCDSSIKGQK